MPTIIEDPAATFPQCSTYGFQSAPNYLVKITSREGGYERRDRKWSRPLFKYEAVPFGNQHQADIENINAFWHAMGGMWSGFRFRDWSDYKSCGLDASPTAYDQPLVSSGDSPASYRLIKQYSAGSIIQEREITRPVGSGYTDRLHTYAGIQIANDGGVIQTDWTLDEATGLVTLGGGFSGTPNSWGGEFDVWCRFDAQWSVTISNFKIMTATIQLAEIRLPLA
jgi:uncharacterized protein (TIGR02217 family)